MSNDLSDQLSEEVLFKDLDINFSRSSLLNDIEGELKCGIDIRDSKFEHYQKYREIADLRRNLRKTEVSNLQEIDDVIDKSSWKEVFSLCNEFLTKYTKDIEIASWFLESISRIYGIQGLIYGLSIFADIVSKYGKDLYPHSEEEDDDEDKLLSISVLNGQSEVGSLVIVFYMVPILFSIDENSWNAWQIKKILEEEQLPGLTTNLENFSKSDGITSILHSLDKKLLEEYKDLSITLKNTVNVFNQSLSTKFGSACPKINNINNVLTYVTGILSSLFEISNQNSVSSNVVEQNNETKTSNSLGQIPSIVDRTEAVKSLEKLSIFFKKSDPHSPATYLLTRVVKWFNSSLENVLVEVLDEQDRYKYCKMTGVPFISNQQQKNEGYEDDEDY